MPTNSYDLIVIGDDFAGVVAATICARRGMRVLIAESGERPASYKLGPYTLPVEPLAVVGMESPAVARVIDDLHFHHNLKRKLEAREPAFQFVAPDARIDVSRDEDLLARELGREVDHGPTWARLCDAASRISGLFDAPLAHDSTFPPTGFWERRETARTAGRLEDEADTWLSSLEGDVGRAMLMLPSVLGTRLTVDALGAEAIARSFDQWRQGAPRIQGDWGGLREIFLEKFATLNGERRAITPTALSYRWGRVTGLELDDGEELGAQYLVCATDAATFADLTGKKTPKQLRQSADALSVAGYHYTLNLVMDENGLPEGMASTVLLSADPASPLTGDNALGIYVGIPDDEARVVVSVQANCPLPEGSLDDALAELRLRIHERLETVMPFFSDHVIVSHSPHEDVPPEGLDGELDLANPVLPSRLWRSSLDANLGVSAVPYNIGFKNVSMASSQVLPGLGLEGSFAAGWSAATLACAASGKKKDYLKDEVIAGG
jgi:phytoene dehydrogenase-like protein